MTPRPPRSTLFPYTTLFRSIRFTESLPKTRSGKIMRRLLREIATNGEVKGDTTTLEDFSVLAKLSSEEERSEEHTSELQSRRDLVCRLLLEKKKKSNMYN